MELTEEELMNDISLDPKDAAALRREIDRLREEEREKKKKINKWWNRKKFE